MKKLFCLSLIFVALSTNAGTSTVQITGQITKTQEQTFPEIAILRSFGSAFPKTIDTVAVSSFGNYEFKKDIEKPSTYYISVGSQSYKVLLHPAEKKFRFSNELNSKTNYTIEESKENAAYRTFNESVSAFEKDFFDILKANLTVDSCNTLLKKLYTDYYSNLKKVTSAYPESFTAKELCKIKQFKPLNEILEAKNVKQFVRTHYADNLHFNNEDLLREPTLNETLLSYLINVADTTSSTIPALIDKVMEESKESPKMFVYVLRQIFQHCIATNREEDLVYLTTKAILDPRIKENITLEIQMRDALRVTKDKPMIEIIGTGLDGKDSYLSKLVVSKKVTLIVFWEPGCSHCKEAMPVLKELYAKYENMGLGIYGVSASEDTAKWTEMVKTEKLNWTNVLMQKRPGEKMAASAYYVLGTPTFVLIGKNGKIIRRFFGQGSLEKEIQKYL